MPGNSVNNEKISWKTVKNCVSDRMINNSLSHALDDRKSVEFNKLLNNELEKYSRFKNYAHYVKIKSAILKKVNKDDDCDESFTRNNSDNPICNSSDSDDEKYENSGEIENSITDGCLKNTLKHSNRKNNSTNNTRRKKHSEISNSPSASRHSSRKSTTQSKLTNFLKKIDVSNDKQSELQKEDEEEEVINSKENATLTRNSSRKSPRNCTQVSQPPPTSTEQDNQKTKTQKTREDVKKNLSLIISNVERKDTTEDNDDRSNFNDSHFDSELNLSNVLAVAQSTQYPVDMSFESDDCRQSKDSGVSNANSVCNGSSNEALSEKNKDPYSSENETLKYSDIEQNSTKRKAKPVKITNTQIVNNRVKIVDNQQLSYNFDRKESRSLKTSDTSSKRKSLTICFTDNQVDEENSDGNETLREKTPKQNKEIEEIEEKQKSSKSVKGEKLQEEKKFESNDESKSDEEQDDDKRRNEISLKEGRESRGKTEKVKELVPKFRENIRNTPKKRMYKQIRCPIKRRGEKEDSGEMSEMSQIDEENLQLTQKIGRKIIEDEEEEEEGEKVGEEDEEEKEGEEEEEKEEEKEEEEEDEVNDVDVDVDKIEDEVDDKIEDEDDDKIENEVDDKDEDENNDEDEDENSDEDKVENNEEDEDVNVDIDDDDDNDEEIKSQENLISKNNFSRTDEKQKHIEKSPKNSDTEEESNSESSDENLTIRNPPDNNPTERQKSPESSSKENDNSTSPSQFTAKNKPNNSNSSDEDNKESIFDTQSQDIFCSQSTIADDNRPRNIFTQFKLRENSISDNDEEMHLTLETEQPTNLDDSKIEIDEHKITIPEEYSEDTEMMSAQSLATVNRKKRLDLFHSKDTSSSDEETKKTPIKLNSDSEKEGKKSKKKKKRNSKSEDSIKSENDDHEERTKKKQKKKNKSTDIEKIEIETNNLEEKTKKKKKKKENSIKNIISDSMEEEKGENVEKTAELKSKKKERKNSKTENSDDISEECGKNPQVENEGRDEHVEKTVELKSKEKEGKNSKTENSDGNISEECVENERRGEGTNSRDNNDDVDTDFETYLRQGVSFIRNIDDATTPVKKKKKSKKEKNEIQEEGKNVESEETNNDETLKQNDSSQTLSEGNNQIQKANKTKDEDLKYALSSLKKINHKYLDEINERMKNQSLDKSGAGEKKFITQLDDLIETENLVECDLPSLLTVNDISENSEVWVFDIPKKEVSNDWIGKKLCLNGSELKIGAKNYQVTGKKLDTMTCVLNSNKTKRPYKAVHFRPICSVYVQSKNSGNNSTDVDNESAKENSEPAKKTEVKETKKKSPSVENKSKRRKNNTSHKDEKILKSGQKRRHNSPTSEDNKEDLKPCIKRKKFMDINEFLLDEKPPVVPPKVSNVYNQIYTTDDSDVEITDGETKMKKEKLETQRKTPLLITKKKIKNSPKKEKDEETFKSPVKKEKYATEKNKNKTKIDMKIKKKNKEDFNVSKNSSNWSVENISDLEEENQAEISKKLKKKKTLKNILQEFQPRKHRDNVTTDTSDIDVKDREKIKKKLKKKKKKRRLSESLNTMENFSDEDIKPKEEKSKKKTKELVSFDH